MTEQKKPRPIPIEVRVTEYGRGPAGLYLVADIADGARGPQREEQEEAWIGWHGNSCITKNWNLRPGCFAVAFEADVDAVFGPPVARLGLGSWAHEKPLTSKHEPPSPQIPREPKRSSKELEKLARGENPRDRVPVPAVGERCPRCHRTVSAARSWPCQLCAPEQVDMLKQRSAVASAPAFKFDRFPGFGWDPEGLG